MSSFTRKTKNPWTGEWEMALWLDDYFGKYYYGVKFKDGRVADPVHDKCETEDSPQ